MAGEREFNSRDFKCRCLIEALKRAVDDIGDDEEKDEYFPGLQAILPIALKLIMGLWTLIISMKEENDFPSTAKMQMKSRRLIFFVKLLFSYSSSDGDNLASKMEKIDSTLDEVELKSK